MKKLYILIALFVAGAANANIASVDISFSDKTKETRTYELKRVSENTLRLRVPKADIKKDADKIDIFLDFASAPIGSKGYYLLPRGDVIDFNARNGNFAGGKLIMPFVAMKTEKNVFWAHIKTMRGEALAHAKVAKGVFTPIIAYRFENTPNGMYDDILIDFNFMPLSAGYVEIGKAYRNYLLSSGAVKPIKERMKTAPHLEYLAKAIPVRIQYHGAKPRQDKDFTPENEPTIKPVLDFKKSIEFVDSFKKQGVGEIVFCSAGWQSGGYDGRFPDLFPIPEELGGEQALREFIAHTKKIGYMIHAHTNSTDCYTCSRRWNGGEIAAKNRDGTPQRGHYWCGGRAYNLCAKDAWERYLKDDLKKVKELGFQGPHYIDVFSAIPPYYCADKKHPATTTDMGNVQKEIAEYCKDLFGGFASECGFDHVGGQLDYVNYVSARMRNWLRAKTPGAKPKNTGEASLAAYVDKYVPLWEIVYHGVILSNPDRLTQNHSLGKTKASGSGDLRFNERDGVQDPYATLKLYEFGGRPIFYTCNFKDIPLIKKAYDEFLPYRHLQLEFIEDHKYLTDDATLTVFGNGEAIVCNYGSEPFKFKGKTINPMEFKLVKMRQKKPARIRENLVK